MSRKFIAAIVTASLIVTGVTASQAQAGDKRTRNLLLGVTTLAIIGAAIASDRRDDRRAHVGTSNPRPGLHPRPLPPRLRRGDLPRRCLRTIPTRDGGSIRMYGARCMDRHYARADQLPRECRQRIWTQNGTRRGYSAQCLRRHLHASGGDWPYRDYGKHKRRKH